MTTCCTLGFGVTVQEWMITFIIWTTDTLETFLLTLECKLFAHTITCWFYLVGRKEGGAMRVIFMVLDILLVTWRTFPSRHHLM